MLEHMGFNEFTKTFKIKLSEGKLLKLGARKIGEVVQEDKYYKHKKTNKILRIRKEKNTDTVLYSHRDIKHSKEFIHSQKFTGKIQEEKIKVLKKEYKEEIQVNKRRSVFVYGSVIINIDKVDNLGEFVGFVILDKSKREVMNSLIEKLEITINPIKSTYFDMLLIKQKPLDSFFFKLYDIFGQFAYGISSGALTTLGVMVGLMGATASRLAVIGGILSIAVADSMSDAIGVYSLKKSERGTSQKQAVKSGLNVFFGKFVFALTFLIPFLLFSLVTAIIISIIWGIMAIIFLNLLIAIAQEEKIGKTILRNTAIAIGVIILSYLVGLLINYIFK
ncbi:MAG: hypothetical protein WCX82_04160 [archaeon]|jgi:predicted adenylyl cyclase CyaB